MKKLAIVIGAAVLLAGIASAGVVKATKSEITFKGFGTFRLEQTETIGGQRRLGNMNSEFKGKGLLGGLAAKTILRPGQIDEIYDLPGRTIYQITPKRKEYTSQAIESWAETQKKALAGGDEKAPAEKTESDVKIVRSEFKVEDTGEARTFGAFPCRKYQVLWTVDWENVKTGEKGSDRLVTAVWTTPPNDETRKALAEEAAFYKSYMAAVGLNSEKLSQDVLGTQWMAVLGSFDPAGGGSRPAGPDAAAVAREMKKIEGYPIVTDGQYFPAPRAQAAQAEEKGGGGLGGALGKLGAGLMKKKPDPAQEKAPALAFYTEVLSLSVRAVDESAFRVPEGFKKKN